jgi:cytoskeletal protein RodZ
MKTVGEVLKETRELKNLTLDQVSHATRIQKKYLLAIEKNDFKQIPTQEYAKGYVKNYSDFLGLNARNILAFLRRQTREVPKSVLLPQKASGPLRKSRFILTPGRFVVIVVVVLLLSFISYFFLQYQRLQLPPTLIVQEPKDQQVIQAQRIDVLGATDPSATISINGVGVLVRSDGKFFDQVQLFPGENTISITATSRYGKTASVTKVVQVVQE